MTRVDFYILSGHEPHARRVTACRLIEKAFRQGHSVYLKTGSAEETRQFDDLLWTFRQGSFVPHELAGAPEAEAPVIIGHEAPPEGLRDVLVNMGMSMPEGFEGFDRVAELVDQEEAIKRAGRERYKQYQAQGHAITTHQLDRPDA